MEAPLNWWGGKAYLVSDLLALLPPHNVYVEPFAGGARLLFCKPPSPLEVINDIDEGVTHFYRVLRDPDLFPEFFRRASLVPYARRTWREFRDTWEEQQDPVERAVRWFYVARASFSGAFGRGWSHTVSSPIAVRRWLSAVDSLPEFHDRLRQVQIEHGDWKRVMEDYASPDTLCYCDPPYVPETRSKPRMYRHEMTQEQHEAFVAYLLDYPGMIMVSGYDHPLYRQLEAHGWERREFSATLFAYGITRRGKRAHKGHRVEVVWSNPRCVRSRESGCANSRTST
jgi:DNA adenine methylase